MGSRGCKLINKISAAVQPLVGRKVPKPSGSLSGHNAGLPFEREVHAALAREFPARCFRHFEALNVVLERHPEARSLEDRLELFGPPSLRSLVARGSAPTKRWTPQSPFEEKQDDTAETIIFSNADCDFWNGEVTLIDVKTQAAAKKGQPPNIMSAGKLATALADALREGEVKFDIVYVGILWETAGDTLEAVDVCAKSLFKMAGDPYINWVAAQQIQFHPFAIDQDFTGSKEVWAKAFLRGFVSSLGKRIAKEQERLAEFRPLIN